MDPARHRQPAVTGSGGKAPPPTAPNPRTYSNGKPGISMQKLKNRPNTETNTVQDQGCHPHPKLPTHAGQAVLLSSQAAYLSPISETETLGSVSSWEGNISSRPQIQRSPNKFKTTPSLPNIKTLRCSAPKESNGYLGFPRLFPMSLG